MKKWQLALVVGLAFGCGACAATTQGAVPDLKLRGDRFRPLTYGELDADQRAMADSILHGQRGKLSGPYNVLLRSPRTGDLAQRFGEAVRFNGTVPPKLNEFAILIVARHWNGTHEYAVHREIAIQRGLRPEIVDDLAASRYPAGMSEDEAAVYDFCRELLTTTAVSDATFSRAKEILGERGLVDLMSTMGYYSMISMVLRVDRYPLEPDVSSPFEEEAGAPGELGVGS